MILSRSIRLRMMLHFCAVVGVLLVFSFTGMYFLFERVVQEQLDRRLRDTANPIILDQIADPDEKHVDELNIPEEYFEARHTTGRLLQHSRHLSGPSLTLPAAGARTPRYDTI